MWPSEKELTGMLDPNGGLTVAVLKSDEIATITSVLKDWYPEIVVGMESCHLSTAFYHDSCHLADRADSSRQPVLPLLVKREGDWKGFVTFEVDVRARSITSRLGVVNPLNRGEKIGHLGPLLLEGIGRAMGMGVAYYQVTLKIPHQQVIAEKLGFKLVGFLPAIDLDLVSAEGPKRVTEGIYTKVLAPSHDVLEPNLDAMTPKTRALYDLIFRT
jgi:hypothetical protein